MRGYVLTLACVALVGCATGEDASDEFNVATDGATAKETRVDEDAGDKPDSSTAPSDTAVESPDTAIAMDSFVASDTSVVVTDTFVPVADTFVADTFVPDTFVADTFVPDTFVADTFVADTFVPTDTGTVDPCSVALTYDFESGDQGFTHVPLSTFATDDPWKRGTPSGTATVCHGGSNCFSTGLTSNYATCQTAELRTPTFDLSTCAASSKAVRFSFWHYYVFEGSSILWDGGLLQVSTDGKTWTDVTTSQAYDGTIDGSYSGCSPTPLVALHKGWGGTIPGGAWKQVTYDVPKTQRVAGLRFRFVFGSDEATNKRGWYVDDVAMTSL